jgi:hypothetical protein
MSQIPWKRRPTLFPKPCFQSGCRLGSYMRAVYSISFLVTGWTSALSWCFWDQWWFPKSMAMLAVSMSQMSCCDKFRGERFCEHIGTLEGASWPVIGVTTLGSNGALVVSSVLIIVCDIVWHCCCTEESKIGLDNSEGIVFSAVLAGVFGRPGVWTFWNLFLKISASFVSAVTVSSPMCANVTSGWGFFNALDMSLAATINLSVEENCGEKLKCVYYAFTSRGRNVHVLRSVMMHGWAQRIAMLAVRCPSASFCWFLVRNNFASWRCKICFVVINEPMEVSCSG